MSSYRTRFPRKNHYLATAKNRFPLHEPALCRDFGIMSGQNFPSGPWVGFYTYSSSTRRFLMDLNLRFQNGKIDGDGADGLDTFAITGVYDSQKMECSWQKIYPTRSAVAYQGFREGKGIWGRWTLTNAHGGFHIWPLTEGGPPDLRRMEEEEPLKIEESRPLVPLKTSFSIRKHESMKT